MNLMYSQMLLEHVAMDGSNPNPWFFVSVSNQKPITKKIMDILWSFAAFMSHNPQLRASTRKLPAAEQHLCRMLFALMAGALMMTMRATRAEPVVGRSMSSSGKTGEGRELEAIYIGYD